MAPPVVIPWLGLTLTKFSLSLFHTISSIHPPALSSRLSVVAAATYIASALVVSSYTFLTGPLNNLGAARRLERASHALSTLIASFR